MNRRGFTITEIMIALMLLSVAAFVATRLSYQTIRAMETHQRTMWEHDTRESLIVQLRADAWASSGFTMPSPTEVRFTGGKGAITYQIDDHTVIRTGDAGSDWRWTLENPPVVQRRGSLIQVSFANGRQILLPTLSLVRKEAR